MEHWKFASGIGHFLDHSETYVFQNIKNLTQKIEIWNATVVPQYNNFKRCFEADNKSKAVYINIYCGLCWIIFSLGMIISHPTIKFYKRKAGDVKSIEGKRMLYRSDNTGEFLTFVVIVGFLFIYCQLNHLLIQRIPKDFVF